MKILFFTSSNEDYLGDSLLHGMRQLYGRDCVDYPKCEILYKDCPQHILNQVRGKGFTLYTGLLEDIVVDRFNIEDKIKSNYFNLIVISDIQRQFGWFVQFRPWLNSTNTVIIDGSDTSQPYPARGFWWRKPYYWLLPNAHKDFLYFKREWTSDTHFHLWMRLLPKKIRTKLPQPKNLREISFSIPDCKIVTKLPDKRKDFPTHIVDPELASLIPNSHTTYAFDSEQKYYADLQESRFGITTKRAGWDCLRHYEIAANGTVPCFRNLSNKQKHCAPHGLTEENTIFYNNASDLIERLSKISQDDYKYLQLGALDWARNNTTAQQARKLISKIPFCSSYTKID